MQNASGKADSGMDQTDVSVSETRQTSFLGPVERTKEILSRLSHDWGGEIDHTTIAVSGGTDSIVAADVFARYGPEFGFEPDSITHINTGPAVPQTRLTAKIIADIHGLEFIEQGYRNKQDSIAARYLENGGAGAYAGSPWAGGHGLEWANRKDKPMNAVYADLDGMQLWVSGARKLESKKRSGNVPDNGIEKDKPRRVWVSPIAGWTSEEKRDYIKDRGLPVSESYLVLGFSGECVACSYDNAGLLTDIDLLCPELSHCIRTLVVWLYMRVKRGEVDLAPKRLVWGWDPGEEINVDDETQQTLSEDTAQSMVGCSEDNCKTMDERPTWVLDLPQDQLVTREDIETHWNTGKAPQRFPL